MTRKTITEALFAAAHENRLGIQFLYSDDHKERLGYAEILDRSLRVSARLRRGGVAVGSYVPVILPTGPSFVTAFYGIILAGAIPCPIAIPTSFGSTEAFVERVVSTCQYVGATHLVANRDIVAGLRPFLPAIALVSDDELASAPVDAVFAPHVAELEDVALLQCTSGSTGAPKGVMLSHSNLSANAAQMGSALELGARDVLVSWLPLNHDMGLISGVLLPLFVGFDNVLMSPSRFLRRPATWLRAISDYRGTMSPAPNFGFAYTRTRVRDEDLVGLDLSSWRWPLCGAEPIDCHNLRRFAERFAAVGLPKTAVQPCYGLAEASLAVTIHRGAPFTHDTVDREALAGGDVIDSAEPAGAFELANCGAPVAGTWVRIVDASGNILPDGRIGRIEISGPSVMKGYYNLPEATAAKLRDGWLDTGDLGYLRDGQLRVAGRTQDVIIIRGKKYDPTEFERAAEQIAGVRCSVGFGVRSPEHARDLIYVVCETEKSLADNFHDVCTQIANTVAARTGLRPDHVLVTAARRAIARTTSGKLQRQQTKALVLSGRLGTPWKVA